MHYKVIAVYVTCQAIKSAFVALIKKNSEVPSNALILAELINLTLLDLHAKTTVFYYLQNSFVPLHKYGSHFSIYSKSLITKLITKTTKNGLFLWSFISSFTLNSVLISLHKYSQFIKLNIV